MFEGEQTPWSPQRRNTMPDARPALVAASRTTHADDADVHHRTEPMTRIEPTLTQAPILRSWLRAAWRHFAPRPPTPQPITLRGSLLLPPAVDDARVDMRPTRSPTSRCCGEPVSSPLPAAAAIPSEDWDLLFQAVLEVLARVAVEKPAPDSTGLRLQAPGTALRECMDALEQLRRSVPREQDRRMSEPTRADGGTRDRVADPHSGTTLPAGRYATQWPIAR